MIKRITFMVWALVFLALPVSCVKGNTGGINPSAMSIEGFEWHLIEVGGSPVSPLPGERQPFILFNAVKKQATGFAGCNNFFGSYELDGPALKFGPVGATRMFCEGEPGEVELKFMGALEKTRSWEIRDGVLLLNNGDVLARFTIAAGGDSAAVDPGSMTFLSTWVPSGKVTLSHGEYREPAAPGSASEIVVRLSNQKAFGMIEGKEAGAVVLVTSTAGSGTFYDLALVIKEPNGWANTDSVPLGDRVKVHSVELENDEIVVAMTTHGPDDPMCCPTLEVKKRFSVRGNRLVSPAEEMAHEETTITGTVWHWVHTLYNDDRKAVPADPQNYTVQFLEDGTLSVKADCNMKGGTWSASPGEKRLSIEITHSTMAACPEGSLEDEFVRGLSGAAIYFVSDGDLYIDMKYDSGTVRLSGKKDEQP